MRLRESMRLKMPTYEKDGKVYAYTRQTHHYSIYVNDADLIEKYKPRLGNASYGKNCIRYRDAEAIKWDVLDVMLHEACRFQLLHYPFEIEKQQLIYVINR